MIEREIGQPGVGSRLITDRRGTVLTSAAATALFFDQTFMSGPVSSVPTLFSTRLANWRGKMGGRQSRWMGPSRGETTWASADEPSRG